MKSSNFELYSQYYDLLYKDKDYRSEASFILKQLRLTTSLFELGCGTGQHAIEFAKIGIQVQGVDLSRSMLKMATDKLSKLEQTVRSKIKLFYGDATRFNFKKKYSAGISLFHVASYQTSNQSFINYLMTAHRNLKKSGRFVFDFWYGPAVLLIRPEKRKKILENKDIKITRFANPILKPQSNIVEVHYKLKIYDKKTKAVYFNHETHKMRYFFLPELEHTISALGFNIIKINNWMSNRQIDESNWTGYAVIEKK